MTAFTGNALQLALADRVEKAMLTREQLTRTLALHLNMGKKGHHYTFTTSVPQLSLVKRSWYDKGLRRNAVTWHWFTPLLSGEYATASALIEALRNPPREKG